MYSKSIVLYINKIKWNIKFANWLVEDACLALSCWLELFYILVGNILLSLQIEADYFFESN
jgi:hypothetical protein